MNIDQTIDKTTVDFAALKAQQKCVGESNVATQNGDGKLAASTLSAASYSVRLSPQYQSVANPVSNSDSLDTKKSDAIDQAVEGFKHAYDIIRDEFNEDKKAIVDDIKKAIADSKRTVDDIKKATADGKSIVDAEKIADGVIASVKFLIKS